MSRISLYKMNPKTRKLYVFVDSKWRIHIPSFFTSPYGKKTYRLHYIGNDTIQAVIKGESHCKSNSSSRIYISAAIQKFMNIQISDAFEISQCENGYILKKVKREDIE